MEKKFKLPRYEYGEQALNKEIVKRGMKSKEYSWTVLREGNELELTEYDTIPADKDKVQLYLLFIEDEINKLWEELSKRVGVFTKEELECILKWKDACDGEFNGMTLLPASGEDWGKEEDIESAEDKLEEMLSKLKDNKQMGKKEREKKLREITTSERVGFLFAVGNDDLLIEELDKFIQEELDKAREEERKRTLYEVIEVLLSKLKDNK